ncbi:MAG TPA: hypothetical protein VFV38_25475 [Ktedonobacteraceae bacterium]|nr:hypothetical protein [Ktedonobacteraceae bacterium]
MVKLVKLGVILALSLTMSLSLFTSGAFAQNANHSTASNTARIVTTNMLQEAHKALQPDGCCGFNQGCCGSTRFTHFTRVVKITRIIRITRFTRFHHFNGCGGWDGCGGSGGFGGFGGFNGCGGFGGCSGFNDDGGW